MFFYVLSVLPLKRIVTKQKKVFYILFLFFVLFTIINW